MSAVPPELLAILACPVCKAPLTDTSAALRCAACARDYLVKDGIPDLVP